MTPHWNTIARQQLQQLLLQLATVPESEWQWLNDTIDAVELRRHQFLCEPETLPAYLYFLYDGLARFYYITDEGKEFNKAFSRSGDLVAPLTALATQTPPGFAIQLLSDSRVLRIPTRILLSLYDRHWCWDRVGRKLAEQTALRKERREKQLLLVSARARYDAFAQTYPGLEVVIPQKHIAAYIGITEVALSRLLKSSEKKDVSRENTTE